MTTFERHSLTPWLLLAPQLVVVAIFFFWPAAESLRQAFYVQDAFGLGERFVGLANFQHVLASPGYWHAFGVTALFSLLVAAGAMGLALLLAVLADRVLHGARLYRVLLTWPYAVAPAVAGLLWLFMFDPVLGVLTHALAAIGVHWDAQLDPGQALALVVIASIWQQMSYNFVFFLAGLQMIPASLLEAAAIDGAGPFRRFFGITLPLLSPTAFFLLVMNSVYVLFETFATIDSTTLGGPGGATRTLVYKLYEDGFVGRDLGGSSAQSVLLMILVGVLTFIQFRYLERRVAY
ncbi:sn-glycerol-3-phosphate ABC transporter permease UgpA [Salinicola endophyticus]|uniref:sn-glycerol-3-phosphate transport system permease protein UgpA n=1 Tax=Salinicola endophyticus TaxID=1949083 RepID=A0ABY8FF65_9GAMM|nr:MULTISPECIES: sn-glycerol-3-phosphate ABC transporter permease UgpA [Salinicola]WFF41462.1 sn-glycerol-3-phosphate ABC transporter permease UgpA [Salinicola endophyticus]